MGHSLNEIDLPNCNDGQILKKTVSDWVCGDMNSLSAVLVDVPITILMII
jgi:hypothetical protein